MLSMTFSFEDFESSSRIFEVYSKIIGYPNIQASDTDKYQGIVDFLNKRTGEIIFQGFDGIFIEFDDALYEIRFYDSDKKNNLLRTYKERITKLNGDVENDEAISTYKPYDNLHRPALGNIVIWCGGTYQITGVRPIRGSNLVEIIIGDLAVRSDDLLQYGRYVNARICGWKDDSNTEQK